MIVKSTGNGGTTLSEVREKVNPMWHFAGETNSQNSSCNNNKKNPNRL